jgi:hypothetical protein
MRKLADLDRITLFMRALGGATNESAKVYFTGGATAVLLGWRATVVASGKSWAPNDGFSVRGLLLILDLLIEP